MKKISKKFLDLLARYLILFLAAIPNLWIFYFVFTPLTLYTSYFLLDIFFDASLVGNLISVGSCYPIEIIKACVAGSAYYLLFFLNLATPEIKIKQRIQAIAFAFSSLFILNIFRIFLLSILFIKDSSIVETLHVISWSVVSVVAVVGIWFAEVKIFKIKKIPVYSDIKLLLKQIKK